MPSFMEAAVHLGSLLVLLVYFWTDVINLFRGFFHLLRGRYTDEAHLCLSLLLASLPAIIIGFVIQKTIGRSLFQSLDVIAWTTLIFGFLLYLADQFPKTRDLKNLPLSHALILGLAQCLAFVHGVSRSGISITTGRFLSYTPAASVRFAFLMAIPALKGAVFLNALKLMHTPLDASKTLIVFVVGVSFVTGLMAIHFLIKLLRSDLLRLIAIYRIALGLFLLAGLWFGFF